MLGKANAVQDAFQNTLGCKSKDKVITLVET